MIPSSGPPPPPPPPPPGPPQQPQGQSWAAVVQQAQQQPQPYYAPNTGYSTYAYAQPGYYGYPQQQAAAAPAPAPGQQQHQQQLQDPSYAAWYAAWYGGQGQQQQQQHYQHQYYHQQQPPTAAATYAQVAAGQHQQQPQRAPTPPMQLPPPQVLSPPVTTAAAAAAAAAKSPRQQDEARRKLEEMRAQHHAHLTAQRQQQAQQGGGAGTSATANRFAAARAGSKQTQAGGAGGGAAAARAPPPALNKWIERCLVAVATTQDSAAQQRMEAALGAYIRTLAERGELGLHNWATKPLFTMEEAEAAAYGPGGGGGQASRKRPRPGPRWDAEAEEEDDGYGHYGPGAGARGGRGGRGAGRGGRGIEALLSPKKAKQLSQKKAKAEAKAAARAAREAAASASGGLLAEDEATKRRRLARFEQDKLTARPRGVVWGTDEDDGRGDFDFKTTEVVVGTCQGLEKEYFRLNEVPHPSSVRPEPVLQRALARLEKRFAGLPQGDSAKERAARAVDYREYLWTQLKAIRQDLLVQNLRGPFMVRAYEAHARVALRCGDLNEYNQCQTQLMEHYRDPALRAQGACAHEAEFVAYRLLYYLYLQSQPRYQGGDAGLLRVLAQLKPAHKADPAVQHALEVRRAWSLNNYHRLGRLSRATPHLGRYIIEHFMGQVRVRALQAIVKAYKPMVGRAFVQAELGFDPSASPPPPPPSLPKARKGGGKEGKAAAEEVEEEDPTGLRFLAKAGMVVMEAPAGSGLFVVDTKQSRVDPSAANDRSLM